MFIQPYQLDEIAFASCYRVYYRWQTHRLRPEPALPKLDRETLQSLIEGYDIHVLESSATETDVKILASLLPTEAVAAAASKLKGRASKWLRGHAKWPQEEKLFSRGYFACTTGTSTAEAVNTYLDRQGEHHGYASRSPSPVFVMRYPLTPAGEERLKTDHAATLLQFHLVLATWHREGVFSPSSAEAVADCWREAQSQHRIFLEKVSFVPDHAHLAVRMHPAASPAAVVIALMNLSQEMVWKEFADLVIQSRLERLWQPSGYIGSYGDLQSVKIAAYVRKWERAEKDREA